MKSSYQIWILFTALLALAAGSALFAQDAEPAPASVDTESVTEPERASYLERHHALRRVAILKKRTLEDIKRLNILVGNYGGEVQSAAEDLKAIRDTYHDAEKERYRQRFVESQRLHSKAREQVIELYKKFTSKYTEQVADLLKQCADALVDAEFAVSAEPGTVQDVGSTAIMRNSRKLRIAYQQTALSEEMLRQDRPDVAVVHLRLAKVFAIQVLQGLEVDPVKKDEIEKKYERDLLDARGLSVGEKQESAP